MGPPPATNSIVDAFFMNWHYYTGCFRIPQLHYNWKYNNDIEILNSPTFRIFTWITNGGWPSWSGHLYLIWRPQRNGSLLDPMGGSRWDPMAVWISRERWFIRLTCRVQVEISMQWEAQAFMAHELLVACAFWDLWLLRNAKGEVEALTQESENSFHSPASCWVNTREHEPLLLPVRKCGR